MRGITFNNLPSVSPTASSRMDVVCFIGFSSMQERPVVSETLEGWLREYGWDDEKIKQAHADPAGLLNFPMPVESWEGFQALFDDKRLDRQGRVRSRTLSDPLNISDEDRQVYLIIDHKPQTVTLAPDPAHKPLKLETLVKQLNNQLSRARAFINISQHLVIERAEETSAGEITVYANKSIGFHETQQDDASYMQSYLAGAVKAFFRQGGKKCYVVCMGNPLPYNAEETERIRRLYQLLWGEKEISRLRGIDRLTKEDLKHISFPEIPNGVSPKQDWYGLSHLVMLSDVTYVCLPDLVDLPGMPETKIPVSPKKPKEEVFVSCSTPLRNPPWFYITPKGVPMFSETDYRLWKRFIDTTLFFLCNYVPNCQLIAGLPMPDYRMHKDFERFVVDDLLSGNEVNDKNYRHLHLAFPWLRTTQSDFLPDALEPPEGILAGLLAKGALSNGAFRSIAGALQEWAYDLEPQDINAYNHIGSKDESFSDRVCWFDFIPEGIALQSDVTAVRGQNYRYGVVRRIMILVQKAAQEIGLDHIFEMSSERTWLTIEDNLTDLLMKIYQKNGLQGKSSMEAFSVVCNRSTMSQNDIDNGRLVASITLQPALPIEQIAVDLLLERDGGSILRSIIL